MTRRWRPKELLEREVEGARDPDDRVEGRRHLLVLDLRQRGDRHAALPAEALERPAVLPPQLANPPSETGKSSLRFGLRAGLFFLCRRLVSRHRLPARSSRFSLIGRDCGISRRSIN